MSFFLSFIVKQCIFTLNLRIQMGKNVLYIVLIIFVLALLCSCSVSKYIEDDYFYLKEIKVTSDNDKAIKEYALTDYIRQTPNTKWFGAKVPMKLYCLSGTDTTSWKCRFFRKLGEAPVVYDHTLSRKSKEDMRLMLVNEGYMNAEVDLDESFTGKILSLGYIVHLGERYSIRNVRRNVADAKLYEIICRNDTVNSLLKSGMPFNVNLINEERSRITTMLKNMGYYKFNKDYITFTADTCSGSTEVDITVNVKLHLENGHSRPESHRQFRIGEIKYISDITSTELHIDSVTHNGAKILYNNKLYFRPNLLTSNTMFGSGELYSESKLHRTYSNFTRLQAVSYSNVRLVERQGTDTLDCRIIVNHSRPYSVSFDIEGTNSDGDLGAAASASLQHKNLFKGSETLTLKLRGAYEAITGLDGYEGHNYTELGGEVRLNFPMFLFPFVNRNWGAGHNATSEISLQYNRQNRPEFKRRVLTAAWRYRWSSRNQHISHRFDLLEINYVYMPWMSKTFKDQYLDSLGKTNAILKYNYENLLITKLGYTYTYNSLGNAATTYGKNAYTFRANIETSGNVLNGITSLVDGERNAEGQYTFCGIAYAQYVKGDLDYARSVRIDKNNSVAFHAVLGVAYPYGNSKILPFEKRYFAGGANSVRGWSVRSLGPGSYSSSDKGINFINQSGDIKLDFSLEYRAFLFWKINGALFVDAGNIWTIRDYKDQPGGAFKFDEFYKQIAVSYGIGFRVNLDFFILRFDGGMKAVNPAYKGKGKYPLIHPDFGRDFAFHFAVGLPF